MARAARGELSLSSLAAGYYGVRKAATRGRDLRQRLAPFTVVPQRSG